MRCTTFLYIEPNSNTAEENSDLKHLGYLMDTGYINLWLHYYMIHRYCLTGRNQFNTSTLYPDTSGVKSNTGAYTLIHLE